MAYRIKRGDDGVQDALRRIAGEQIDRAIGEIDDDTLEFDVKIHQVRKRCKKMRGLLRLVRPAFDGYRHENASFRDTARLLSGTRDADTLIATYDAVCDHFDRQTDRRAFGSIRARLTREAREIRDSPETADRMSDARQAMIAARERARCWTLEETGFDAIGGGLRKTYRRARKRMQAAWAAPDDAALHEWRKRVKYHWYHARLLGKIAPPMMAPHETAADELSDLLGDHHDLAVLDARLAETPEDFGAKADLEAFRALMRQRKDALAAQSFEQGRLLLAERSGHLAKRWKGYWKLWRKGERAPERLVVKA